MIATVVLLSLKVAIVATLVTLPFAILVAYILARKSFRGKAVLDVLVHMPLVLPPVVTGYGLLLLFGKQGLIGSVLYDWFGITLAFRWTGAALAAGVMGFPLVVRAIRLSIEAVDPGLEEAAATLGASRLRVFCAVTLPLIWPGIIAGAVLGFAKALGEFGATITFAASIPGETRTIPSAIYELLQIPGQENAVWGLIAVSVVIALGAVGLSEWLGRRAVRR